MDLRRVDIILAPGLKATLEAVGAAVTRSRVADVSDDYEGNIGRSFKIIRQIATMVSLATFAGYFPVVLAGNCNATVGVPAGPGDPKNFGVIWFDAYADLDKPDESASGYFDGMGVSMLGTRTFGASAQEAGGISSPGRVWRRFGETEFPHELDVAMDRIDFTEAVVHINLDCLDTTVSKANKYAAQGGLQEADLHNCLYVLSRKVRPLALTVASFDPTLGAEDRIADAGVQAIAGLIFQILNQPERLLDQQPLPTHTETPTPPPDDES